MPIQVEPHESKMDKNVDRQIREAIAELQIWPGVFRQLDSRTAQAVFEKAKETFVKDAPRSWWLSLKYPFVSFDYSDGCGFDRLLRHIPPGENRCWFIPELEGEMPVVFNIDLNFIGRILGRCEYFEYYLVGKDFSWLLVENDHNQIILCLAPS